MRAVALSIALYAVSGAAQAHVADMPILQHAIEHGWLALVLAPLALLLLPIRGERR